MIDSTKTLNKVVKAGVAKGYVKELSDLRKKGTYASVEPIKYIADFDLDAIIGACESLADGYVDFYIETMQRDYLIDYVEYKNPELIVKC